MKSRRPVNSPVMSVFCITGEMKRPAHLLTVVLLFVLVASLDAQAQCNRIDKKLTDFFITFARVVTEPKAAKDYRSRALLRLRNNTDCTIILPSNDEGPSLQIQKLLHRDQT